MKRDGFGLGLRDLGDRVRLEGGGRWEMGDGMERAWTPVTLTFSDWG
jgi:hypothetical protein